MENPKAQRDDTKQRMEIVFSIIAEFQNQLEKGQKPGDATKVQSAGQKDGIETSVEHIVDDLIQTKVKNHDCKYDPETGLSVRIVDGKVIKVNEKIMKELSLEIEKNRQLQIIKEKFDILCYSVVGLDKVEGFSSRYIIDIKPKPNRYSNCCGAPLTQEEFNQFEEMSEKRS